MRVLAFDTATAGCHLAILDGDQVLVDRREAMAHGQAAVLLPWIEAALAEAGLQPGDLDLVAATTGPGAFTGIRIGLAAAKGLALALGIPGMGISSFDAFHALVPDDAKPLLIAIDSRRADLFFRYLTINGDAREQALAPNQLVDWLGGDVTGLRVIGDAADMVANAINAEISVIQTRPDPVVLARLAQERYEWDELAPLEPVYARPPDAKPAKPSRIWLAEQ
ncbi:MAG: tRNA (adenosine(37)-N6)-threonylcarbamoyltransferase complex dimerization subunit type 1 TsaB [Alphaproteobacteria bacterium]|nr:tRNA (adenosine(37)-N6)-threonylcarbamoyltransferase complex dimerization subunit type 1 TsaB [Alphaproteobacteria bacterium SS10]